MRPLNIAIVGATGLVGQNFRSILFEENFNINNLYLFASKRSAGKRILVGENVYIVEELTKENIQSKDIDYALFSAGGNVSKEYATYFTDINAVVVDNSSAFRMEKEVPLVVPEINIDCTRESLLIANPNCSTIQSVLPLEVLKRNYGISNIHYTTYQAVSGSGMNGINELKQTRNGNKPCHYSHPIYNNVLPHIDMFLENGYTKEEEKMILETRKILDIDVPVSATCVRVPIENSHAVSITVTLEKEFEINKVREEFNNFDGIKVVDDTSKNMYPLPTEATGVNDCLVGRIRRDYYNPSILHFFVVGDNIRKGAALNAVQIVKELERRSE